MVENVIADATQSNLIEPIENLMPQSKSSVVDNSDCSFSSSANNMMSQNVQLCYFNARSLRSNLSALHSLLYSFEYQIVCITETWLDISMPDGLLDPENRYRIFRKDRPFDRRGGGVCIFVVGSLNSYNCNCDVDSTDNNIEIVAASIVIGSATINIVCVYIAPNSGKQVFTQCCNILCLLSQSNTSVILGDFNHSKVNWETKFFPDDFRSRELFRLCNEGGLIQLNNYPTRFENILDLVFTNDGTLVYNLSIEPPFCGSDHEVVTVSLNVNCYVNIGSENGNAGLVFDDNSSICNTKLTVSDGFFRWSAAKWFSLDNSLYDIDWNNVIVSELDSDTNWINFNNVLFECIALNVPYVEKRSSKNCITSSKGKKKLPKHIRKLTAKKRLCWKNCKSRPTIHRKAKYKAVSARLKKSIFIQEVEKEKNMIRSKNIGQFYKYVSKKSDHKSDIPPLKAENGSLLFNETEKAEALNSYFVSNCTVDNGILPPFSVASPKKSFKDIHSISISQIYSKLRKLKSTYSAGPDGLPPILFKQLARSLAYPLFLLFNQILSSGRLPNMWKLANVLPLYKKKGNISDPANYRPISLTCVACKVYESFIKQHLLEYLTENEMLSKDQHGFLQGKSTCSNLLEAMNDWTSNIEDKLVTFVLSLDFAKAFDSLSVPKLIFKLEKLGIRGQVLNSIKSFLHGRMQRVKIGQNYSSFKSVTSGVPQGSVLGPILFVIFINDIVHASTSGNIVKLFADDLKSYVSGNNLACKEIFISSVNDICEWAKLWQLPIAFKKSSWGLICRGSEIDVEMAFGEENLVRIEEVKDLGVKFNFKLNFSAHIDDVISKAKQRLFLLKKCIVSKDAGTLIKGFKAYVMPILDYNSQIWSPNRIGDIARIESVQRSFLKHLKGFEGLAYGDRLTKAQLCTLELRRVRSDLVLCYKIIHNLIPLNQADFFKFDTQNKTRGNKLKIKPNKAKTNARFSFFSSRIIKIWNSLPNDAVCSANLYVFKNYISKMNLSKFLIQQFDKLVVVDTALSI
jgi:Reverse transcriptase (RNA-dependent DNA polymerase)/Endonuclease-reverse transcriptase